MKKIPLVQLLAPRLQNLWRCSLKQELPRLGPSALDDTHKVTAVPVKKGRQSKIQRHRQIHQLMGEDVNSMITA